MATPSTPPAETLHGLIGAIAAREPDRVALIEGDIQVTFGELWNRATRAAGGLNALGVKTGDVVAIEMPRSIDLVVACLGAMMAGGVLLLLDARGPTARNRKLALKARAEFVLVRGSSAALEIGISIDADGLGATGHAPFEAALEKDDDALIVFTSGSTGEPKGVAYTHRALAERAHLQVGAYPGRDEKHLLRTSPSFPAFAVLLGLLAQGRALVIVSEEDGSDLRRIVDIIERHEVAHAVFPPRFIEGLLTLPDVEARLRALTRLGSHGERLPMDLAREVRRRLPWCCVVDRYGAAETLGLGYAELADPESLSRHRSHFTLLPGVEVKIVSVEGHGSEEGEIWVSSPMLARGYIEPETTGEAKFVVLGDQGAGPRAWYRTGDRGALDAQGRLIVLGRLGGGLKVLGASIDPVEVEIALRSHEGIADAAVSTFDGERGALLVAYIVVRDAADRTKNPGSAALRSYLSGRVPSTHIPSRFVRLDSLPRLPSGKVDRRALPAATVTLARHPPRTQLEGKLLELFRAVLENPDVGITDDFFEWGGDSIRGVDLMTRISRLTGLTLPAALLIEAPTVAWLTPYFVRATPREIVAVWMRRGGDLPPLVCVPGLLGDPLWYQPLIASLPPRLPIAGLGLSALHFGTTIDDAADRALEALDALGISGPCSFLGYSVGGLFALEMARRLRAAGLEVAFVGLIDTVVPRFPRLREPRAPFTHRFRRRLRSLVRRALDFGRRSHDAAPHSTTSLRNATIRAANTHVIHPFDFDVTLFRVNDSLVLDPLNGWGSFARAKLKVVPIDGRHLTVILDGRSQDLGATIRREIESAFALTGAT